MDIKNTQSIKRILKENDVEFAGIFGSRARGSENATSDLDILVRFKKTTSLSRFAHLRNTLHEEFQVPVDLVTEQSLSPHMRDSALKDMKVIYGSR